MAMIKTTTKSAISTTILQQQLHMHLCCNACWERCRFKVISISLYLWRILIMCLKVSFSDGNRFRLFSCRRNTEKSYIFYFNIFQNAIYPAMTKLNFRQPLLQSSVSHDLQNQNLLILMFPNVKHLNSRFIDLQLVKNCKHCSILSIH